MIMSGRSLVMVSGAGSGVLFGGQAFSLTVCSISASNLSLDSSIAGRHFSASMIDPNLSGFLVVSEPCPLFSFREIFV